MTGFDNPLIGRRIKFISTTDRYAKLVTGQLGTIDFVDATGTLHVVWDDGQTLGMVPGEDQYEILPEEN